jgi:hypothetical protein
MLVFGLLPGHHAVAAEKQLIVAIFPPPDDPFSSSRRILSSESEIPRVAVGNYSPAAVSHAASTLMTNILECIYTLITLLTIFIIFHPLIGDDG